MSQSNANVIDNDNVSREEVQEETWVNEDGVNIFDAILDAPLEERQLWLPRRSVGLLYRSFPESTMTPLDMNYYDTAGDEFYDGTGTMVWLAARALAWTLDQDIHKLFSQHFLVSNRPVQGSTIEPKAVCELGCGTGMAGLAALLLAAAAQRDDDCDPPPWAGLCLAFTDNDQESLDNCKANCGINKLPNNSYSHHRLSWGIPETYPPELMGKVDIVMASDVLYDMKMVLPLFQSTASLLRDPDPFHGKSSEGNGGGIMILSHVPRFCLPRDGELKDQTDSSSSQCLQRQQPYLDLENHLVVQARSVGLHVVDQFRPHTLLQSNASSIVSGEEQSAVPTDVLQPTDLQRLEQAHSIIYVFQKRDSGDRSLVRDYDSSTMDGVSTVI